MVVDKSQVPTKNINDTLEDGGPPLYPEQSLEYKKILLLRNVGVHTIVWDLLQVPFDEKKDTRMNKIRSKMSKKLI